MFGKGLPRNLHPRPPAVTGTNTPRIRKSHLGARLGEEPQLHRQPEAPLFPKAKKTSFTLVKQMPSFEASSTLSFQCFTTVRERNLLSVSPVSTSKMRLMEADCVSKKERKP